MSFDEHKYCFRKLNFYPPKKTWESGSFDL